jgi:large subunit ribosomal protein L17
MRHRVSGRKLGRTSSHRRAMFRNQLASFIEHERIRTTLHKAKELRPLAEKMITQGKRDSLHARRLVRRWVDDRSLIKKLFDEIAPRFAERPGGYTRIIKLGPRLGDAAEMAILELVEKSEEAAPEPKKAKDKGKK